MPLQRLIRADITPGEIDLAAAIARREVVPFLGSAVSIVAAKESGLPNAFPSWPAFVKALIQQSGHPTLDPALQISSAGFPDLLQVLIDDTGTRNDVAEVIESHFGRAVPYAEIVKHARLLKLLTEARPPFVLTTNYDNLLEHLWPSAPVFDLYIKDLPSILEYVADPHAPEDRPRAIIKLHGTVEDQARAAVSARDYRRLFTDTNAVQALFLWIGQRYSIWFLGYSLSDPDVQSALFNLQAKVPYRQHFWHKLDFDHRLEPRVRHVQFSIRSFQLQNDLTERIASITGLASHLETLTPVRLFEASDEEFFRTVSVLSRFERPENQAVAHATLHSWYSAIRRETEDWARPLSGNRWQRVLAAEQVLRHLLFIADRFEERKQLSRYVLNFAGGIPISFRLEAAGAIAEGLGYLEKNEHAISDARELIRRHAAHRSHCDPASLAFARSLVARSEARWEQDSEQRWVSLDTAVREAAKAGAAEFHAACLLDRAQIAVGELVGKQDQADRRLLSDGVVAARAALELSLYGGSYRRASIALQRLTFLDEDASHFWAGQATKMQRDMRLPPEPRNQFYLDCAVAVSLWRTRQRHYARTIVRRYDEGWFAAHARSETASAPADTARERSRRGAP
jgi:hypothetical protein